MVKVIDGFSFNDFCLTCQMVMEHKVTLEGKDFFGICGSCESKRLMADLNEVYYPKTELWVTRFKIGNMPGVVTGRLTKTSRGTRTSSP
jgi:hypothetical protein